MRPDLLADISSRLKVDYAFKVKGDWLREGRCPDCGKKELYRNWRRFFICLICRSG